MELLKHMVSASLGSFKRQYGALLVASLIAMAPVLVGQGMGWLLRPVQERSDVRSAEYMQMQRDMLNSCMQGQVPAAAPGTTPTMTEEEARQSMEDSLLTGGVGCVAILIWIFVGFPALTSAAVAGVAAVSQRTATPRLACGFVRYWQSIALWLLLWLAYFVASLPIGCFVTIAVVMYMTAGGNPTSRDPGLLLIGVGGYLLMSPFLAWVAARLVWSGIRVADPWRTAAGPLRSWSISWRATSGATQWPIFWCVAFIGLIGVALMIPGWALVFVGLETHSTLLEAVGTLLALALQLFLFVPWLLAALGTIYERIIPWEEPGVGAPLGGGSALPGQAALSQ